MRISGAPSICARSALLLAALGGCGISAPGVLVGESDHFRLFVDPDLAPTAMQGTDALTALETDWADKQTMLHMPPGRKIDYYLVTAAHAASACGLLLADVPTDQEGGCEVPGHVMVVTNTVPMQHELIHAYMDLLSPGALPIPLVAEGTAESIGCTEDGSFAIADDVPWPQTVLGTPHTENAGDVYNQGAKLMRYLIRGRGIDAVVGYYRQAPQRRDPALFAANFLAYWGTTIDDVWAAMQVPAPGGDRFDQTICPCSLPPLPTDGTPIPDDVTTHPYWTVSGAAGTSVALSAADGQGLKNIKDCQGVRADLPDLATSDATVAGVYQLPPDDRIWYLPAPVGTASVGAFVSDTCAGAAPYPLPAGIVAAGGTSLNVSLVQQTADSQTFYLQVQLPAPAAIRVSQAVQPCLTCDFTRPSCQGLTAPDAGIFDPLPVHFAAGDVYLRITVPPVPAGFSPPYETSAEVFFQ
jgi:hypothetical protein